MASPFAQKPSGIGGHSPFGSSPSGSSLPGVTSADVFGQPSTVTSSPAYGTSSSSGGSTQFGQNAGFGCFGPAPDGSTWQQTRHTFGSNSFGTSKTVGSYCGLSKTQFGASTSAFSASAAPTFGDTTSPTSSATNFPAFGSSTTFEVSSSGTSSSSGNAFVFGKPSTPGFGVTCTPSFRSSTPFGTPTQSFGPPQSTSGSVTVGTILSSFGTQSSSSGAQTDAFAFGSQGFQQKTYGGQQGGTRVAKHTPTTAEDLGRAAKILLQSISAMPVYEHRSHEELRWDDHRHGDKGGPSFAGQSAPCVGFPVPKQTNFLSPAGPFGHTNPNSFSSDAPPFLTSGTPASTVSVPTSTSAFNSPFIASSPSSFNSTSSTSLGISLFPTSSTFSFTSPSSTSLGVSSTIGCGSNNPMFIGSNAPGSSPSTTVSGTQPSSLSWFSSPSHCPSFLSQFSTPSIGQTPSPLGQSVVGLEKSSSFTPNVSGTTTGIGLNNQASSMLPLDNPRDFSQTVVNPSFVPTVRPATPVQPPSYFPTQPAPSTCSCGTSSVFGHEAYQQVPSNQSNTVMQPVATVNPFGTLPTAPQMLPGRISVQCGISSMPVSEKPTSTRISNLSTPRHSSQRRISLPLRKYNAKTDSLKVPFFVDDGMQTSSEADLFIPRENPRSLVVWPTEQWPSRDGKQPILKHMHNSTNGNATSAGNDCPKEQHNRPLSPPKSATRNLNEVLSSQFQKQEDPASMKISGHRAGDADIADIEALMPKLRHCDYYTEPRIQELAAKERAVPGFCCHVKDFVVGRHGYGCIKFYGETDVRGLDLESIIQFNNREVLVYKDGSGKPPVGHGLNKPAEITLLNIKCIDKKTGVHYTEGLMAARYKEMLMKKAEKQGGEFVSYDAAKGLWKFMVGFF